MLLGQRKLGRGKSGRKIVVAALLIGLLAAACSSSSKTTNPPSDLPTSTTTLIAAPAGLPAFYSVPQPISPEPGAIIKAEAVSLPDIHGTVYRVMYSSLTVQSTSVAVTGLVFVPKTSPPADGYPVVTWGHGTNGMADSCAASLDAADAVPLVNDLLDQGWEVTASDYQGEGTPGILPYIAGVSAARNTIDIVRAAHNLTAAHASRNYVVWGHSEGGQTAMYALSIGATYAPEYNLKGVVAGAPPSQFSLIYAFLKTSPYRYYLLMAAGGLNAAYGDTVAPLDQLLKPAGMALIPDLDRGCTGYLSKVMGNLDVSKLVKADPFKIPAWRKVLMYNDPENFATASAAPLLMIQGGNDEQIPVASTQLLAQHLCKIGQNLERWIYPGQSHAGVITPSAPDMIHWIADRFAGVTSPDPYKPTGLAGIQTTTCPS